MNSPPDVRPDPTWNPAAVAATQRYLRAAAKLTDRTFWPVLMHVNTNLFLWHLDAFAKNEDPVPLFVSAFDAATRVFETASAGICQGLFPADPGANADEFEEKVTGLFSDVWVAMTDDIYFDQAHAFTCERLEKNGIDPKGLFAGKVVIDAGCGSGKFSAAIARLGARKVIGVDLGAKGLEFARAQAAKTNYADKLEFRHGSLLDMPVADSVADVVWSNGVIHHTLGYETCVQEFARVLKPGGTLFLYVNGRFGLFELLQDSLRTANQFVPRTLFQQFLQLLGVNPGRLYWMMDCLYAPYEWRRGSDVVSLLTDSGFSNIVQLKRGVATDQIEQITTGLPFASVKYGEGQLKYLAVKG